MNLTESETLELKKSFGEWKEIIKTLCAFANAKGGTVIVGFDNNGKFADLHVGAQTIEDFVNKLKHNTDPVLYPSINVKTFALGEMVEITIPKSDYKPVFAFGRAYRRVGKSTVQLSTAEIKELIKKYTLPDFDRQFTSISLQEFEVDEKLLQKYKIDFNQILQKFNLVKENKLSNAGYLCFTKVNSLFSNAVIKAARFKGNTPVNFIDMQDFTGNLLIAVDEVMNFIKKHINRQVIIGDKPQREERWDYPLPALREAVINAIVHRNYEDKGNIQIRIFDDKLEIWSPGLLPKEIDINDIARTNRSIPRNHKLADLFYHFGLIENWGTGLLRIIDYSKSYGIGEPEFEHIQGVLVIRFFKLSANGLSGELSGELNGELSGELNGELNYKQKLVYQTIKQKKGINSKQLSELLDIPFSTVDKQIRVLLSKGLIERRGSKKTGGYFVK